MEDGVKTKGGIKLLEENENLGYILKEGSNGVEKVEFCEEGLSYAIDEQGKDKIWRVRYFLKSEAQGYQLVEVG